MKIPPAPRWNKATDSLESPVQWMRSMLPPDTVFPQIGQIWEAGQDCELLCLAHFASQPLNARMSRLRRGQKVRIVGVLDDFHLRFVPLDYEELHGALVPESIRMATGYTGYDMLGTTQWLNGVFRPIDKVA